MEKALLSISCCLFAIFSAFSVYAAEADNTASAFNPPKDAQQIAPLSEPRPTSEADKKSEEEKQKALVAQQAYVKRMQQAGIDANAAIEKCRAKYKIGKIKTHIQLVKCYNPAIVAIYKRADYPYMDLIQSLNDKRVAVAKRIDKKTLTEAQGEAELSKFSAGIVEEERKRNDARVKQPPTEKPAESPGQ